MTISTQRQTAEALVKAFNEMDVDAIVSFRDPKALRHLIPESMGNKPQDNDTYARSLKQIRTVFTDFSLTVNDILEDRDGRRICLWATARGNSAAGHYVNEYVWLLDFDETGTKILGSKEYSDTIMARDFFPKLQAAMTAHQAQVKA